MVSDPALPEVNMKTHCVKFCWFDAILYSYASIRLSNFENTASYLGGDRA